MRCSKECIWENFTKFVKNTTTMKRLFVFLTAILTFVVATAQVEHSIILDQNSFRKVNTDALTGVNVDPIRKDSSRNACARVKIQFANMSRAEVDALVIQFRSNTDIARQEIGYYDNVLILEITAKPATRFYVQSPEYGQSNEVTLNLEGDCEYEMQARLNQSFSIIVDSNVADADVYIDGIKKARTDANKRATIKEVMIGEHTLKVTCNGVSAEQKIVVNGDNILFKLDVNIAASEPQFVVFIVEPKSAVVTINNQPYPLQDGAMQIVLDAGTYSYSVTAAGYYTQSGQFTVAGDKVEKRLSLTADSATVTLTAPDNAEIWINGALKGKGTWRGTLNSGTYIFEARKAGHKGSRFSQKITSATAVQTYTLPAPTPIYGSLVVSGTPIAADVTLDGKAVGTMPLKISNVLVGDHTLKISKSGYNDKTQTITISEDKTTTITATLTKQSAPASATTTTPKPISSSSSGTYNIGDLVTVNGVQGIVFQTSPEVKIVSVKEGYAEWGEYTVTTNATDKDNGKANMAKIKSISGWETKYPAFKWCADYGNGWYLPALNELKAIYAQRDKINKTLSANNMDKLGSKFSCLWSSSESSSRYVYSVSFSSGSDYDCYKDFNNAVRAVYVIASSSNTTSASVQTPTPSAPSSVTPAPKTYNIGDLVTVNGVQGIVFQTSPVVKIVSVKEATARWSVNCQDASITDRDNGRGNTYKIRSKSDWRNQYPAFRWCADYGSGWYLPAINELNEIYAQKDKINKTLSANGMDKLCSQASTLWSSTEYNHSLAGSIYFSGGSVGSSTKYHINAVRAVRVLD